MPNTVPLHYTVHIEPDIEKFVFTGKTSIRIEVEDSETIVLNVNELNVKSVVVDMRGEEKEATFQVDLEKQTLTIELGIPYSGEVTVTVDYTGEINDKLMGFYRSRFVQNGEEKYAAVTQFQESDARRAFPCFDEPGMKATFDISFLVDKDDYTISNTEIEIEEIRGDKKFVKFHTTPKMSTYLLFFGVGAFEAIEDTVNNKKVRVVAHPGLAEKHGKFALDFGMKTLAYCEEYYDIEFPIPKLDLIATPSFAHGAMENWGAVLFRENLLLHYEGVTSKRGETRIQEVIAHEIAHQWFGNLVTPISWKYLWLNESFATFFGFGVIDHYYPEKHIWDEFVKSETAVALAEDAKHHTAPIEKLGDESVGMTITNAPILYNKGGSVLRQVQAYVGEDMFREGLRHYLKQHAYGNTKSDDLWESLEKVSGKPVSRLMESWVLQEGYPLVAVSGTDKKLKVRQQRFTYLPMDSSTSWLIPISVKVFRADGTTQVMEFLLGSEEGELDIGSNVEAFKLNVDQTSFIRVKYDEEYYEKLGELVREKKISTIDRWSIENDAYALLKAKMLSLTTYLKLVDAYGNEDEGMPLESIATHLRQLDLDLPEELRDKAKEAAASFFTSVFETIGFEPKDGETDDIASARGRLLNVASLFSHQPAIDFALKKFEEYKAGQTLSPDLIGPILMIAARETNDYDYFYRGFKEAENEQMAINFITALASFTSEENIEKVKGLVFEELPLRNRGTAITILARNTKAKSGVWHWYLANLDGFEALFPYMQQYSIVSIVAASRDHEEDVRSFFTDYVKKNPVAKEAYDIGMEYLQISKQMQTVVA